MWNRDADRHIPAWQNPHFVGHRPSAVSSAESPDPRKHSFFRLFSSRSHLIELSLQKISVRGQPIRYRFCYSYLLGYRVMFK